MSTNLQPMSPGIRFSGIHRAPRIPQAEEALWGAPATEASFRAAAEVADAEPLAGNAFKVPLACNTIARTLLDLGEEKR